MLVMLDDIPCGLADRAYSIFDAPLVTDDLGQIVGTYADSSGLHGFLDRLLHGQHATLNDPLATPGAVEPGVLTFAFGVNDQGQIVGTYADSSGFHGFLDRDGQYTTLNDPLAIANSSFGTFAEGINDLGQVVGWYGNDSGAHGFLYSHGQYTTLNDPLGIGDDTFAYGVNNKGQIVGAYADNSGVHGFLSSHGQYTTLNDPLATESTRAEGINDLGQIVGFYGDSSGEHDSSTATVSTPR